MKPRLQSNALQWVCVLQQEQSGVVCLLACTYFLQELAELSAFGISGAQVLLGCHHGADAAPICILSRAVHLPPLLWPDGLHSGAGVQTRRKSPQNYTKVTKAIPPGQRHCRHVPALDVLFCPHAWSGPLPHLVFSLSSTQKHFTLLLYDYMAWLSSKFDNWTRNCFILTAPPLLPILPRKCS